MTSGTGRIKWVDTFRAIMILCIAFGHAAKDGALKQYVYSFHVAAFFFISGYLFRMSDLGFKQFAWKKFKSLMIPYYMFSIMSIFVFAVLGSFASEKLGVAIKTVDIPFNIVGMLWANGQTGYMKWNLPLWFIPCLFATTVVAYPIEKWISKCFRRKISAYWVIGTCAMVLSVINYNVLHLYKLPFQLETLIFMMPFFALGLVYREVSKKYDDSNPVLGVALIIVGYLLGVYANTSVNYVSSSYGNIAVFYLSAIISIAGYVCVSKLILSKALYYVGQNTLPILLMHKFPIVALQIVFSFFLNSSHILSSIAAMLITVVSCSACLLADLLLKRYIPFIYGRQTKNH